MNEKSERLDPRYQHAITEAANRAEATALLVRCDYRVYRPEADTHGEDMVIRRPTGELAGVQLKSRAVVDQNRYGADGLLMLFPSGPFTLGKARQWFLIEHDRLFKWLWDRHGHTQMKSSEHWSVPHIGKELRKFLKDYEVRPPAAAESEPDGAV
jgi:hypothetical protein